MKPHRIIVCGGTFDLLHAGHRKFLQQVFEKGEKVIIGLTSDKYISENKPNKNVAPYEVRKKSLENFLEESGVEGRVMILPIDDMYGPLLDPEFKADAIAVTPDSKISAEKINTKRVGYGLSPLEIAEVPLIKDEEGEVISSTRIRQSLLLPPTLRHLLQDAWGEILDDVPLDLDMNKVITVGDITTGKFVEKKLFPKLTIIDNKVERKEKKFKYAFPSEHEVIQVENPAGSISPKLSQEILHSIQNDKKVAIIVEGEEDLAVLPALLHAPNGFTVFYGQPRVGLVQLEVTQENKKKAQDLVDRFEIV